MKITFEIPDWAIEDRRVLHLMAGIERVGYKLPWEDSWMVKTSRCSSCGDCCKKLDCEKLKKAPGKDGGYVCTDGVMRPYLCCTSEPKNNSNCTSKYKKVV